MFRNTLLVSFFAIVCGSCIADAFAASQEQFVAPIPPAWEKAFANDEGNVQLTEYVQSGETIDTWKQLITVTVLSGTTDKSIKDLAEATGHFMRSACPGSEFRTLKEGSENGFEFTFAMHVCPTNPKTQMGEVTIVKSIKGNEGIYTYQHAWRLAAFDYGKNPVPLNEIGLASATAAKARVCNATSTMTCAFLLDDLKNIKTPALLAK